MFEALTVFENLELAMAADKRILPPTAIMKAEYRDRIDEILEMIGLRRCATSPPASSPTANSGWRSAC